MKDKQLLEYEKTQKDYDSQEYNPDELEAYLNQVDTQTDQVNPVKKQEPPIMVTLEDKYKKFLHAQEQEDPSDVDSSIKRAFYEQEYFKSKIDAIDNRRLDQRSVLSLEKDILKEFNEKKTSNSKEVYKEQFKEQVLQSLHEPTEEEQYKVNFKQQILASIKEPTQNEKENKKSNQKENSSYNREKQLKEMKAFEETHSFDEVYKLKKEALEEIKEMDLTDAQREKLLNLERALDTEKQEYDKGKVSNKSDTIEEKTKRNKFLELFGKKDKELEKTEQKNPRKTKQKDYEMDI